MVRYVGDVRVAPGTVKAGAPVIPDSNKQIDELPTTTVIARQSGGTAGTDEVQITHNGSNGQIESKSGELILKAAGNNVIPGSGGVDSLGRDDIPWLDLFYSGAIKQATSNDQFLLYADVAVSSAEILALNATPKTLVAAPGANKFLRFRGAVLFLDYNSAAYAGIAAGEDLLIRYTDGSGNTVGKCEVTGFLDGTADDYRSLMPVTSTGAALQDVDPALNAALVLHMSTGEIITGDSPMGVRVYYDSIDLSTLSAT
jgi:hypothetical protein